MEKHNYSSFHTAVCLGLHSGPFVVLDGLGFKPQGILKRAESEFTSILLLAKLFYNLACTKQSNHSGGEDSLLLKMC